MGKDNSPVQKQGHLIPSQPFSFSEAGLTFSVSYNNLIPSIYIFLFKKNSTLCHYSFPLLPPIICISKDCWFVFKQISGNTHTEHITGGKGCSKYTMQLCSKRSPCKEPKAIKDTNTTEHAQRGSLGAQQC